MTTDGDKVKPNLKSVPPQCSKKGEFNPPTGKTDF